jgi:hypothetical protein
MKVSYFGYCLKNDETMERKRLDLPRLLKNYCRLDNVEFKNQFLHQDEHLYLMYENSNVFLFLITRNSELIRTINTNNLSVAEVNDLLENGEALGFASYLLIKDDCFGFGSTLMAPKANIFIRYVNDLLGSLGVTDWRFSAEAILHQATRADALQMPFIGKATISVEKENNVAQDFIGALGLTQDETADIDGFEVTIRPKARKNIREAVSKLINTTADDGIIKMTIRAKEELDSQISDFYLVGKGHISDSVDKSNQTRITGLLNEKFNSNRHLHSKLREYINRENLQEADFDALVRLSDNATWANIIMGLQEPN